MNAITKIARTVADHIDGYVDQELAKHPMTPAVEAKLRSSLLTNHARTARGTATNAGNKGLPIATPPIIALKGKGKAQREAAYFQIAPFAFVEALSRDQSVTNLRVALGATPSADEVKAAQIEWVIGRVAAKLPASEFPKADMAGGDKLEHARKLVTRYASPAKDGTQARKLRKDQEGRRTITQHKVIRAAEEAWSLIKAELGQGMAQTQAQRNAAKTVKQGEAVGAKGKGATVQGKGANKATAPTHVELVKPTAALSEDEACQYLMTQGATLLAYANKNAKVIPTDFGAAIQALKSALNKAENARQVAKLAKGAEA